MADQKPAPRPMYQPTPEELKNLHSRMDDTPKAGYYRRAREILADVDGNLFFDLRTGWSVRSQSDANLWHPDRHAIRSSALQLHQLPVGSDRAQLAAHLPQPPYQGSRKIPAPAVQAHDCLHGLPHHPGPTLLAGAVGSPAAHQESHVQRHRAARQRPGAEPIRRMAAPVSPRPRCRTPHLARAVASV